MRQRANRREWSRRVSQWRRSGRTSKEFAAETGLNASTLLWWSSKLKGEGGLRVAPRGKRRSLSGRALEGIGELPLVELRSCVGNDRYELELGCGRRLRIPPGFDAETLGRLLAVIE
jgi:hypothetical protein